METTAKKPETPKERKVKGYVEIEIQKCKGCEICRTACKENALQLSDTINIKGYRYIIANNDLCTGCVNCALVCPDAVITVYRTGVKKKRVDITPKNIKEEIKSIITSPVYGDLTAMDYI
ncbi:MAG: 4Fe-4S dicluster domain-containing protein [Ignavibacteria bacterium]|nr:4Fe-4S dicluster domain-containing protein [Ignavibacteria bacterium]